MQCAVKRMQTLFHCGVRVLKAEYHSMYLMLVSVDQKLKIFDEKLSASSLLLRPRKEFSMVRLKMFSCII